ncbi:hypothetical protein DA798_02435 [Lactobacillus sp. PFC-70]|nr:hypothetical protein DA798_02435 [Lactobacillus sp. PFC-70]
MTKQQQHGLIWGGIGVIFSAYALVGSFSWAYRLIPYQPVNLSLGLVGCVISLIGIVRTARQATGWSTVWLVLAFWLALVGAAVDGLLLWFGQTVTGFY